MTATLIKATGEQSPITPANGKDFKLEELQRAVGGFVEVLNLPDRRIMLMNEDGKFSGLPRNDLATVMAYNIQSADFIVGDVIVCPSSMLK